MTRLLMTMRNDVTVQFRNNLYYIGIFVAVLIAVLLSRLVTGDALGSSVPNLMLALLGGSTMLYVAGMILFEKDEGTINALIVTPLNTSEYLGSKIITLTALATIEAMVSIIGAILILSNAGEVILPNFPILLLGIIALGAQYTLFGIILIVRYESITDFLVPVIAISLVLLLPGLYFSGIITSPVLLIIPSAAPTMIIQGAFTELSVAEWAYALGYTVALMGLMIVWAHRAFHTHIIMKVG